MTREHDKLCVVWLHYLHYCWRRNLENGAGIGRVGHLVMVAIQHNKIPYPPNSHLPTHLAHHL